MAAPSSSQSGTPTAQNSFVQLSIKGLDSAGLSETVEEFQKVLNSRFPKGWIYSVQKGENWSAGEDGSMKQERPQCISGSDENQPPQPPFSQSHPLVSDPGIESTNPSLDSLSPHPQFSIHEQNKHLKESLERAAMETKDLASDFSKLKQERDDLYRQSQSNKLKIRRLNDLIVKTSQSSGEPMDDQIKQEMLKVRNMTTEVIQRFYPGEASFRTSLAKNLKNSYPDHYHFYQSRILEDRNPERRRRLLRSLLFLELQNLFFGPNARLFGLPSEHMEGGFQELEWRIEASNEVSPEESIEWRTRTIACARKLGFSNQWRIEKYTEYLFAILEPMKLQDGENGAVNLRKSLKDLCSAALELSLRFRSSKTKYEFKMYPNHTILSTCDEKIAKGIFSEGPISQPTDRSKLQIFCTLFGALVKTPPPVAGEASVSIVLEEGQVVAYQTTPGVIP